MALDITYLPHVDSLCHVAFNGRRTLVRQDTLHCGWTIRGSAITVFLYRMQASGHDVREGGAHHL